MCVDYKGFILVLSCLLDILFMLCNLLSSFRRSAHFELLNFEPRNGHSPLKQRSEKRRRHRNGL